MTLDQAANEARVALAQVISLRPEYMLEGETDYAACLRQAGEWFDNEEINELCQPLQISIRGTKRAKLVRLVACALQFDADGKLLTAAPDVTSIR